MVLLLHFFFLSLVQQYPDCSAKKPSWKCKYDKPSEWESRWKLLFKHLQPLKTYKTHVPFICCNICPSFPIWWWDLWNKSENQMVQIIQQYSIKEYLNVMYFSICSWLKGNMPDLSKQSLKVEVLFAPCNYKCFFMVPCWEKICFLVFLAKELYLNTLHQM